MVELVTIGYLTLDDLVLRDGRVLRDTLGGGALFSAVGAQLWGGTVGISACTGRDYPAAYRRRLEAAGLDLAGVRVGPARSLRLWLLEEDAVRKQQLPKLSSGQLEQMDAGRGALPSAYREARGFHVATSLPAAQALAVRAIRAAAPGTIISLDLWVEPFFDPAAYRDPTFLAEVDAFLPSDKEVEALWGGDDLVGVARRLARLGPATVAIKRGERGSLIYDRGRDTFWTVPAVPVRAVDTTGAGDAFCGGFLAGMVATGDPLEAALRGTVSASFAVEEYGAQAGMGADAAEARCRLANLRPRVRTATGEGISDEK